MKEALDISTLSLEERMKLFMTGVNQVLGTAEYDLDSFRAQFRDQFDVSPEPLFHATKPATIRVGKLNSPLVEIPLTEFEAQEKMTWSTSPLIGKEVRTKLNQNIDFSMGFNAAVAEIFQREYPNFAVCDINETAGKGLVFVPSRSTPILAAGSVVGIYTGILSSSHGGKEFCPYGYLVKSPNDPNQPLLFDALHFGNEFFDAEKFRNFTTYVQHAPDEETFSKIQNIPDDLKPFIARANIIASPTVHCGINVLVYYAAQDTTGLLFLDYGSYFDGKPYQLFDHHGNVIGTVNENNQFEKNPGYVLEQNPPKTPKTLSAEQLEKTVTTNAHSSQDLLSFYLMKHAKFVIELYRRRAIPGTESFLDDFIAKLAKVKETTTLHDVIDRIVTIEKRLDPYPALKPLKNELILLLKMHVAYLNLLIKLIKQLQEDPKTCPTKWVGKTEEWKTYGIKEKAYLGFLGRKTDVRNAKKDLAYLHPFITNWDKKELLAVAVSILFAREQEKQEQQKKGVQEKKW